MPRPNKDERPFVRRSGVGIAVVVRVACCCYHYDRHNDDYYYLHWHDYYYDYYDDYCRGTTLSPPGATPVAQLVDVQHVE